MTEPIVFPTGVFARVREGDVIQRLRELPDNSVDCCVSSPPYWRLRTYNHPGQVGLERTRAEYIARICEVYAEVFRVLKPTGTCWINLGDSYNSHGRTGHGTRQGRIQGTSRASANTQDTDRPSEETAREKSLCGIPWRVAFALEEIGWILRRDIIWHKPQAMPESCKDRPSTAHDYIFLMVKRPKYWYDAEAIKEPCSSATNLRGREVNPKARMPFPQNWQGEGGSHDPVEFSGVRTPDTYKGSVPGRKDGPGQDRRSTKDRGPKMEQSDPSENRGARGDAFGRGAGWREGKNEESQDRRKVGFNERWDTKEQEIRSRQNESFSAAVAGTVDMRNSRSVWTFPTCGYKGAHFATFPPELPRRCILAGCPEGGIVLDPFAGSGTTLAVAIELGRYAIGFELNPDYCQMIARRLESVTPSLFFCQEPIGASTGKGAA